jgi:3-methyladenine DNA glycosylase AlkD
MTRTTPSLNEVLARLDALGDPAVKASQGRFGIQVDQSLGISLYTLRELAKGIKDHALALGLWETGIHEARLLAAMVEDVSQVTREQCERWVLDFNSWDICDNVTDDVFIYTPFALELITTWATREEEFVKRAAFAMIAEITIHRKDIPDNVFVDLYPLMVDAAVDERNYVKKAVSWALRNIAKNRPALRKSVRDLAENLLTSDSKSARWVAKDVLNELIRKFGED